MYIIEIQEAVLSYPEDLKYRQGFDNDPNWVKLSDGTEGSVYRKVVNGYKGTVQ